MARILFAPLSIISGLIAGMVAKNVFGAIWGLFDDEEAPDPEHRDVTWPKLIAATALEGAVFAAVRAATDQEMRRRFEHATGVWPGEEERDDT